MAEMIAISIKEDWTPPPSSINCWAVKKGDLGWARGHANQSGWAQVQILDANRMTKVVAGQSSCYIPERIITYGALQCSPKIQFQPARLNSYEVPMFKDSESLLSRAIEALLRRICIEKTLVVENGANANEIGEIQNDIIGFKDRILEGM